MIIAFRNSTEYKPVLDVDDSRSDQVVIRFISRDEHITIHVQRDGTLLRTHYYPDKPPSVWDEERVKTAGGLGLQNPERHGEYVIHTPLPKISNVAGYHLVGRLIDLSGLTPRRRYFNNIDKTIDVSDSKFMLAIYLSTKDNPCDTELERITTHLGEICFKISKPLTIGS